MLTRVLRKDDATFDVQLEAAAKALRAGELVAFPTETVYGLGANAQSAEAISQIYRVKGRPSDNPLIVHLAELHQLETTAIGIPDGAYRLFERFAPGPLTIVLKRHPQILPRVSAGLSTVAVRFPAHELALALLRKAQVPVAAPSANLSGSPSPSVAEHVLQDLNGKIPFIIDGGPCQIGLESTVLDFSQSLPTILRPGAVTAEEIEDCLGFHLTQNSVKDPNATPKSPGMKYRHYAPKAKVTILPAHSAEAAIALIEGDRLRGSGTKVGYYLSSEIAKRLAEVEWFQKDFLPEHCIVFDGSAEQAAQGLFKALRDLDEHGCRLIYVSAVVEAGLGLAYMNRLKKAAADEPLPDIEVNSDI